MACYKPIVAWKPLEGGALHFSEKKGCREIKIPCGQCIGCRISKRDAWAFRCYAESKLHKDNCFVTLTYDPEFMPQYGSLNYRDIQLFHKKLRQKLGPFRFFVCGEYGEQFSRPHYHGLYFGLSFPDAVKSNSVQSKYDIYKSEILSELWGKGFCSIGQVTYESARYCAVYTTKKVTGELAESHYSRVVPETGEIVQIEPEFGRMSLKPGIGHDWLVKYAPELLTHGAVHVYNRKAPIPRFFMDKLALLHEDDFNAMKLRLESKVDYDNNSPSRLAVREECAIGKQRFNSDRRGPSAL
ncbi:MAG: replication initiator protein [Microviridae sp.]|nr:MAG: replication initiator protein [Microviridae sp.]